MKGLLTLGIAVCMIGCNSPAQDESDAAKALAPKPLSDSQKSQMDKIKSQFPAPGGVKPGH